MVKGTSKAENKWDGDEPEKKCWKFLQPLFEQFSVTIRMRQSREFQ